MIDYGGKDLADAFRTVRKNTIQIAEEIPESQYDFRAAPESRSVRETLAHIGASPRFQLHVHVNKITDMGTVNFGELFQKFSAEENKPRSKDELHRLPEIRRRQLRVVPRASRRLVSRRARVAAAGRATGVEDPLRDAARRERARDASSRPAHDAAADDRSGAAPDASDAGAHGLACADTGTVVTRAIAAAIVMAAGAAAVLEGQGPPPISHEYADVNGVRLHYARAGSGPLIVFLHGFPGVLVRVEEPARGIQPRSHGGCARHARLQPVVQAG